MRILVETNMPVFIQTSLYALSVVSVVSAAVKCQAINHLMLGISALRQNVQRADKLLGVYSFL